MRLIDVDHFIATLDTVVEKYESVLWKKIAETMKYMIEAEAKMFPAGEIIHCKDCKHLEKVGENFVCCVWDDYRFEDEFCSGAERKEGCG